MTRTIVALSVAAAAYFGTTACATTKNPVDACSLAPASQIQGATPPNAYPHLTGAPSSTTTENVYYVYDGEDPHTETTKACTYTTDDGYVAAEIKTVNVAQRARGERFDRTYKSFTAPAYAVHAYVPSAAASDALVTMYRIAWIIPKSQAKASRTDITPYGMIFVSNANNVVVTILFTDPVSSSALDRLAQVVDGNVKKMLAPNASSSSSSTTTPPATASASSVPSHPSASSAPASTRP